MPKEKKEIEYPYIPEGKMIKYVPEDNSYMQIAKGTAIQESLDEHHINASVIVKNGSIVAKGANGSTYHDNNECERRRLGVPTGEGYELCEGCHPKNHSEQTAIRNAQENNIATEGADLYLWGHWWCCKPCWDAMIDAGINQVYLMEGSEVSFSPRNERGQYLED